MKKLAPNIVRQRLLLEGYFTIEVTEYEIKTYLQGIAKHLSLCTYGEPIIFSPQGLGKEENQGFDAFIPLIDSGISAYFWLKEHFFSFIIYTRKQFDEEAAATYTKEFFRVSEMDQFSF